MTWIDDYKGNGPWNFTKQYDKPHYNEGNLISNSGEPIWGDAFFADKIDKTPVTPEHHPWCGYWPRPVGVSKDDLAIDADIFILHWSGPATIYGVNFDGVSLSWLGSYQTPGVDTNGLILYEGDLLTIAGAGGVDAELRRISTTAVEGSFPLLSAYNPFNSYDVRTVVNGRLVNGDVGKFYYSDTSTVMVSVHDLVRSKRGFRNTVITGTDSNLYVLYGAVFTWQADWQPITGGHWSSFWNLIEDNICDSTVTSWGGDIKKCYSVQVDECYHGGYLYTVDFSSGSSVLTKTDPTTLNQVARNTDIYSLNRITAHDDKIYVLGGPASATAYIFNVSDLSLVCSIELPAGRAVDGDLEVVGGYLIASTTSYGTSYGTLYKLSLTDLSILDSILSLSGSDTIGIQRLGKLNDTYVSAAWNYGVSVYNIETMGLVDKLELTTIVGEFGYHAQAIAIKYK